jgi:hypothetical protein
MNFDNLTYDAMILAEIIDCTWGHSAQPVIGYSVNAKFADGGQTLVVTASTVTKASMYDRQRVTATVAAELESLIADWIVSVKSAYKERASRALSVKSLEKEHVIDIKPLGRTDRLSDYLVKRTATFVLS